MSATRVNQRRGPGFSSCQSSLHECDSMRTLQTAVIDLMIGCDRKQRPRSNCLRRMWESVDQLPFSAWESRFIETIIYRVLVFAHDDEHDAARDQLESLLRFLPRLT